VSQVDTSATLELLMVRFDNPTSTDDDGDPCDPWHVSPCDHVFQFALDRGDRCSPTSNQYCMIYIVSKEKRSYFIFLHNFAIC